MLNNLVKDIVKACNEIKEICNNSECEDCILANNKFNVKCTIYGLAQKLDEMGWVKDEKK